MSRNADSNRTKFGKRLARVAASFVFAVGLVAVAVPSSAPVLAHEGGGNATGGGQWHSWPSDGCTKVPNWMPTVYNFTHACQHHDGCYVQRWAPRATCDQWFLNDMNASCRTGSTFFTNRANCYAIALAYYAGVRACGQYSYDNRSVGTPLTRLCW